MGQKVHPIGFRLGSFRPWISRWFARKNLKKGSYAQLALEDIRIRRYLESVLDNAEVSLVEIEKDGDNVKIIIHTARPGVIIGRKGQEIDALRKELSRFLGPNRAVAISVQEVKRPELDAVLVAKSIAQQLERRASFKRAMKRAGMTVMRSGAKGVKIRCKGRLGGAEIARSEWVRLGSVPLHTLRAVVDYGFVTAKTTFGIIGVKVWLSTGEHSAVR